MGAGDSKAYGDEYEEESLLSRQDEESAEMISMDYGTGIRSLPYSVIVDQRLPFDDPDLNRLIPNCEIRLSVQDSTFFKDKRCWYTIDLEHGCFRWSVRKRFRDFIYLNQQLQIYRTFLTIQIPEVKLEKSSGRRRSSIVIRTKKIPQVPAFPLTQNLLRRRIDLASKMAALQDYLRNILNIPCYRVYHETLEFLEIGPFSFIEDLGTKGKEGFIRRRSNCGETHFGWICTAICGFWKKRWFFLKENFVALICPSSGELECVLLLDKAFRTKAGRMRTGRTNQLVVQNLNKRLVMQCDSERQALDWAEELNFVLDRGSADFVTPNRYESFAPPRSLSECKWIVDGATYFEAVALAMEAAKEEIFIADWWLSPEIYMRRPTTHGHYWQLDYLLRRKARQGVKIYVLLYKELEMALGINSYHTEQKLSKMHSNIQVLRHPYASKGVLLWAHHEKIVCVDQTYAFVGGLDLCYGRWDDFQHRLNDLGDIEERLRVKRHMSTFTKSSSVVLPTRNASSLSDISEKNKSEEETKLSDEQHKGERHLSMFARSSLIPTTPPRDTGSLPNSLHEVAVSSSSMLEEEHKIEEEMRSRESLARVKKLGRGEKFKGFLRKYQATKHFDGLKRNLSTEFLGQEDDSEVPFSPDQPADYHRKVQEMALVHLGLERKFRLWHGKDYVNFINKDFQDLDQPYSDMINRNITPRMPWHDIGLYVQGMVARDIARHFILRWNHAKDENCPKDKSKPYLIPKSYSTLLETAPSILQDTAGSLYRAECQVLRSLSFWSSNIYDTESSIHKAYVNVIRQSKKFIYIENQFFISQPSGNGNVYNGIADALFNRILKAHRERKDFRVYLVLPLLPAFEGEVGTGTGTLIQAITHWNYKSICRGPDSLKERLSRHMKDPLKYIGFYGLRTHSILDDKPITELVYVHSKLLIADDQVAIIGSANINDRSLLGRRDSEIAVIVRDTNFLKEPHGAGQFCFSLRTALFREHLGLMQRTDSDIDLRDPSCLDFYRNTWNEIAISNTKIYEEVFRCLPTDKIARFPDIKKYHAIADLASIDSEAAKEKLKQIRGFLVLFPLYFLCEERLEPHHIRTKERYLPSSVFT